MGFPEGKMHFPAAKCTFLEKNALSCRKMQLSGGGHRPGSCRKLQEGFKIQESRTLPNFQKTRVLESPGIANEGGGCMGKIGSIFHFPCALPASISVTMTFFVLFFPASGYLGTPKHCKTRKTQNDKSTLFYLPPPT